MTNKEKLEKIKELADAMYYAAQHLTTDASRLHKAMDEYHQFIINEYHKEEPVNEDLEESIDSYIATYFGSEQEKQNWPFLKKMAIHFAEWKKQKDSIPISDDLEKAAKENAKIERSDDTEVGYDINRFGGFVDGALWQKEQMTKTAIDGKIYETQARSKLKAATIGKISGLKYRVGDKVKLIILKED